LSNPDPASTSAAAVLTRRQAGMAGDRADLERYRCVLAAEPDSYRRSARGVTPTDRLSETR